GCPAMVCIGMSHDDPRELFHLPRVIPREHCKDIIMVNTVPGIDHHHLIRRPDEEYAAPARELETEERGTVRDGELLDVGIKSVTGRCVHGPAGGEHAFKYLVGIAAAGHQVLRDMVGIGKE